MITKYIVLAVYFIILMGIGIFASKRITDIRDYYVGGKKLGYWIAALSARATGESGWLLIGVTGMGAMMGVSAYWIVVGEVLGVYLSWQFLAKKFKIATDNYDSITVPDYLVSRFGSTSNTLRIISATALSLFVVIYVSAQIDITGKTFESFLNVNYYTGILMGFGIVLMYISTGGFLAVAWSDFFQGILMFIGLVILPIVTIFYIPDLSAFCKGLSAIDPGLTDIWGSGGFNLLNLVSVIGLISIGIGFLGSPQVYVRFMSIKDENEIKKGKWVAVWYTLITDTAAVTIGLLGRYLLTSVGQDPVLAIGHAGEDVLASLLDMVMPNVIIGVYIAAVLSAIMSTVDSLLVVASSAVTRDFYQQIFHPEIKNDALTSLSKKVTVVIAILALSIALLVSVLSPDRTVFWFVIFGWSGIAATFVPVIILSLLWDGFTEKGAIASMIVGFLSVSIFKFIIPKLPTVGIYFDKLDVMFPSVLLAMIAGYCISKIEK
ncbi:MAG TPA: sodium/proline symporter [Candidatus Marinimicrobia bacterium]|jgi:sodium/proline symporter|nr:sodium/proline symporter [Candidatus Neomarinimicrobiota bacterium]